jgi:ADP-ribosylglycohydrolase
MSKIRDAILGYAIGDAFGLPFEGVEREKLINNPVTEMYGDGSQPVDAGTFSANTSMSIATMDSIIKARELDYDELMKCLTDWIVNGKYTVTGEAIDLDKTTIKALTKYNEALSNGKEIDPLECGIEEEIYSNETLQRMIPIAFYSYYKKLNQEQTLSIIKDVTYLTNKNEINVIG